MGQLLACLWIQLSYLFCCSSFELTTGRNFEALYIFYENQGCTWNSKEQMEADTSSRICPAYSYCFELPGCHSKPMVLVVYFHLSWSLLHYLLQRHVCRSDFWAALKNEHHWVSQYEPSSTLKSCYTDIWCPSTIDCSASQYIQFNSAKSRHLWLHLEIISANARHSDMQPVDYTKQLSCISVK